MSRWRVEKAVDGQRWIVISPRTGKGYLVPTWRLAYDIAHVGARWFA